MSHCLHGIESCLEYKRDMKQLTFNQFMMFMLLCLGHNGIELFLVVSFIEFRRVCKRSSLTAAVLSRNAKKSTWSECTRTMSHWYKGLGQGKDGKSKKRELHCTFVALRCCYLFIIVRTERRRSVALSRQHLTRTTAMVAIDWKPESKYLV